MVGPIWKYCEGGLGCDCVQKREKYEARIANLKGHGTRSKYQKGCRCIACRRGNAKYFRELRNRKAGK